MTLTKTPICNFGEKVKNFELKGVDNRTYKLEDCTGENGLLIMFICNHCPYVKAVIEDIVSDCKKLLEVGVKTVAIMSNDTKEYPQDSFENMILFAKKYGIFFPYLIDVDQNVAKEFRAVCTPDFFGYNMSLELQYRGRIRELKNLKPKRESDSDLLVAMRTIAKTKKGPVNQIPSMGCSIKWVKKCL